MREKIIEIKGKGNGNVSIVLAGVHGDESCGVKLFDELLPSLQIDRGVLYCGYGNPIAIESKLRFTEENLNRMFKEEHLLSASAKDSYEYRRASYLKKYLNKASALLDIHASITPESAPFLICENNSASITSVIPVDLVVYGFDAIQPGGTDYYMNKMGGMGICVECGYLGDVKALDVARDSLMAFLAARNHIDGNLDGAKQKHVRICQMYMTKTDKFVLSKNFKDFEALKEGQLIGYDGSDAIRAEKDGVILFAQNLDEKNGEGFLYGENL